MIEEELKQDASNAERAGTSDLSNVTAETSNSSNVTAETSNSSNVTADSSNPGRKPSGKDNPGYWREKIFQSDHSAEFYTG